MTKKRILLMVALVSLFACINLSGGKPKAEICLKDAYRDKFLIGTDMNSKQILGVDLQSIHLITKHFNAIVAENCMKVNSFSPMKESSIFQLPINLCSLVWGVSDNQSWKNNTPIKGRTDYPLLFDRNYHPKPVVETIIRISNDNHWN